MWTSQQENIEKLACDLVKGFFEFLDKEEVERVRITVEDHTGAIETKARIECEEGNKDPRRPIRHR